MSKSRERLRKFGMQKEFDTWKNNLSKEKFSIGSKVRFKSGYLNVPIGTYGKIVETDGGYKDGIIQIKVSDNKIFDVPLWPQELETYLEEI